MSLVCVAPLLYLRLKWKEEGREKGQGTSIYHRTQNFGGDSGQEDLSSRDEITYHF